MSSSPHHDAETPGPQLEGDKKVATFGPRQLNIVWGNDTRYWKLPSRDSKNVPAELLQVCWLEVNGSFPIEGAVKGSKYKICFNISLKSDAFGWNNCPVYVMAKFGKKGKYVWTKITLKASEQSERPIGDLEVEYTDTATGNDTIYFGLYEVWSGKWKGGLQLHNATIQRTS